MGFFKAIIDSFKKKVAASYIDTLDLYKQCFQSGDYPILLLGEETEVVFDRNLVALLPGERFFKLKYRYVPLDRMITVDLPSSPSNDQTVLFSRKIIFEDPEIWPTDTAALDKSFTGFQLEYIDLHDSNTSTHIASELLTELKGFICPDDEKLKEVVDPVIEYLKGELEGESSIFFAEETTADQEEVAVDQREKNLNTEWHKIGKKIIVVSVVVALQDRFGYNFENNVEAWLARHYNLII